LVSQLEERNGPWFFKFRSAAPSLESGLRPWPCLRKPAACNQRSFTPKR
jgi:hypothetical protein